MGYSFRLAARVLLYAPSHRQDSTYHGLCYTSRGALAGTRNSSMGPPHKGSIRRPIAPWANALTTELHLAPSPLKQTIEDCGWSCSFLREPGAFLTTMFPTKYIIFIFITSQLFLVSTTQTINQTKSQESIGHKQKHFITSPFEFVTNGIQDFVKCCIKSSVHLDLDLTTCCLVDYIRKTMNYDTEICCCGFY